MTLTQERQMMQMLSTIELDMALDIWQEVADDLRAIIRTEGEIRINNKLIWNKYLHRWKNRHWELLLKSGIQLADQHLDMLTTFQQDALFEAWTTFQRYRDQHPRCMDQKTKDMNTKTVAWKWLMSMREIWDQCQQRT